ncbi:DNA polymerase alpha subunit A [Strigomonas culicis]|uniref:DNA polymerase n=1 Tax=Strigomonas culicis TaxID=28005 RepID=S9UJR8_9TRYP|nr:DNA polymerase alpha subunit A [Strigomonas culicis]|eukprot:EPY29168.1 DNA polymerase alpha subunit A [Strigomonas culicis]
MEDTASEDLFFWMDAKEQPYNLSVDPGSIFLFGKMATKENGKQQYKSCCLRVRNVERTVYLLKKKDSSETDVVKEINDLCRKQSIEQRHIKFAERYYAFEEENIPQDKSLWAELRYPGRYPPFQVHASYTHIDAVVGSTYSLLELFLLNRKIMGPCYLRVAQKTLANIHISHCELEYTVDSPVQIMVEPQSLQPPPVTVASIQLHSQLDATGAQSEICVVSLAVYKGVHMDGTLKTVPDALHCGVRPLDNTALPIDLEAFCEKKGLHGVQRFQNETQLLKWCATRLGAIDADILIGHNILGFTINTLVRRYQELNIPGWSTLGRLDLKRFPRIQGQGSSHEKEVCIGRLVADSYLLSREYYKSVNYKLVALAEQMGVRGLVEGKSDFEPGMSVLTPVIQNFSKDLFDVLLQINNNAVLATGIVSHLDAIRLTKRLTSIAGNLWSRSLYGGRSERIEYLLLHTFHDLGFVVPDKKAYGHARHQEEEEEGDEGKRKAKYKGGMVLDPKCGLYTDYILLLDFNSLYPSLIQEFNICFTTVDRRSGEEVGVPPPESLLCGACAAEGRDSPCVHKCVLPKVIKRLVDSRRDVKRLMRSETDPSKLALLEIRQKSLKLTANSMYGCLGFEHSRFHAQALAELVTSQGREALQNTVSLIPQKKPSLRVIYGDTDSVMIQTGIMSDIKEVRDLGLELKAIINKQYKSLEIDIDGVFRAILLLKKKKYAALSVVDWQGEGTVIKKEIKGLDMVRRDWCPLSKKVCDAVLNRVLSARGGEDVLDYLINYMRDVADHVRLGDRYTLDDFVISKSLTKEPESYRGTAFPHATVALRMRERKELVRVGDLIPYVICDGERLADKAYHVDEVRQNKSLHIDADWYVESQIYPPVMRLCEHIQGFSSAQLSEAMGVAYHQAGGAAHPQARAAADDEVDDFSHCALFKNCGLEDCFPTALPLQVTCVHCRCKTPIDPHKRVVDFLATAADPRATFDLYVCTGCHRSLSIEYIANCFGQVCHTVWQHFYQCGGTAAAVRALRVQFTYYRALFEVPHAPGCAQRVKRAHRAQARRCKGINNELVTLEEAARSEELEAVDPLNEAAVAAYKRVENFFINLDAFF